MSENQSIKNMKARKVWKDIFAKIKSNRAGVNRSPPPTPVTDSEQSASAPKVVSKDSVLAEQSKPPQPEQQGHAVMDEDIVVGGQIAMLAEQSKPPQPEQQGHAVMDEDIVVGGKIAMLAEPSKPPQPEQQGHAVMDEDIVVGGKIAMLAEQSKSPQPEQQGHAVMDEDIVVGGKIEPEPAQNIKTRRDKKRINKKIKKEKKRLIKKNAIKAAKKT